MLRHVLMHLLAFEVVFNVCVGILFHLGLVRLWIGLAVTWNYLLDGEYSFCLEPKDTKKMSAYVLFTLTHYRFALWRGGLPTA